MHKLTIVTINYNNCLGLARTCNSILSQSFTEFDWVVIDGGSSDGSLEILSNEKFDGLRVLSGKDNGIYDAMNKGIDNVTTDFVMFLNSGDTLAEETVMRKLHKLIDENDLRVTYGNIRIQSGSRIERHWSSGFINFIKVLFGWHPPHPATIYPLESLKKIEGYDEQYSIAADYDVFLRLYRLGHKFKYIDECITVMEKPGASGGSLVQIFRSNLQVLRSWRNTFKFIPLWILKTKPLYKITQMRPVNLSTVKHEVKK